MTTFFVILGLLVQLALAVMAFIWILAFLGFADETKRSASATFLGKSIVTLCVLIALLPIGVTAWVSWCYFFNAGFWPAVPLGLFLPLVCILACAALCAGLVYLFRKIGYRP